MRVDAELSVPDEHGFGATEDLGSDPVVVCCFLVSKDKGKDEDLSEVESERGKDGNGK